LDRSAIGFLVFLLSSITIIYVLAAFALRRALRWWLGEPKGKLPDLIAEGYSRFPYPRLILALVVFALYLPWLGMPFFIDDYRGLRFMEDFRAGRRSSLDLYRFFTSAKDIAAERNAEYLPWWVSDRARAQLMRPVAEWSLYLDYLWSGNSPVGYHLTSCVMYLLTTWLLLALYRAVRPDETRARWGALLFAVAACNAIPVTFISARCDLAAALATVIAMVAGLRFARTGGKIWAAFAVAATLTALLSKEAALPITLGFAILWWAARSNVEEPARRLFDRRAVVLFGLLACASMVWFYLRIASQYETDATFMLDPIKRPAEYLANAPGRILSYFAAWPLPINVGILWMNKSEQAPMKILTLIGVSIAVALAILFRLRHRGDRSIAGFAAWALIFLPVLACTLPDARLIMLPCFGVSYVGAAWLLTEYDRQWWVWRWTGRCLLRYVPALLLIVLPIPITFITIAFLDSLEVKARDDLIAIGKDIQAAPAVKDPYVFIVSNSENITANSWAGDRARFYLRERAPAISILADIWEVEYEVTGQRTLRMRSVKQPFLSVFSQVALPTGTVLRVGDKFKMPEFTVTVAETQGDRPTVLDVEFREPLNSPRYFFYHWANKKDVPPQRWRPVVGERVTFTTEPWRPQAPASSSPSSRAAAAGGSPAATRAGAS
jgi:hypothetical protein